MRFESIYRENHKDEHSPKKPKAGNTLCLSKLHKCMNSGREHHRRFVPQKIVLLELDTWPSFAVRPLNTVR